MKKLILAFLILAGGGGYAYYYFVYNTPVEKPQISRAPVTQGDIVEQVSATGQLEPWKRVDVGSQVSGVVQKMNVDFNSIVKEGDVLAQIDPTLLQVQVQIQEANIERQKSDIANSRVGLEDLRTQLVRARQLTEKGLQNQQQLEQAELAVKNREAQIYSAEKSLISSEANLAQAKLNVSYTTIKSPIDGVVLDRKVDVGQTVQSSMSVASFFVLTTPLEKLKLTAGVDEADIGRVRAGMTVEFTVETYGQQRFYGTVDAVRLNASIQNNVVTYPVWIAVENPDLRLRPSLTASAKIIISRASNVVRIPNQAFRFRPNADIYAALGLEAPAAGRGRRIGGAGDESNGSTKAGAPGAGRAAGQPGADQPATSIPAAGAPPQAPAGGAGAPPGAPGAETRQPGQGGRGGDRQAGGGRGFGAQTNLTPEQMQAMRERFAQQGGTSGRGGGGGRGDQVQGGQNQMQGRGGGGGRGAQPPAPAVPTSTKEGQKIDEFFQPVPRAESRNSVWMYEDGQEGKPGVLKEINVRLGVTDGTFSELISGGVKVGDQLVTAVILPRPTAAAMSSNPFGQPQRGGPGGFGGMQPGGMPGGMPGGGGRPPGDSGRGGGGR